MPYDGAIRPRAVHAAVGNQKEGAMEMALT